MLLLIIRLYNNWYFLKLSVRCGYTNYLLQCKSKYWRELILIEEWIIWQNIFVYKYILEGGGQYIIWPQNIEPLPIFNNIVFKRLQLNYPLATDAIKTMNQKKFQITYIFINRQQVKNNNKVIGEGVQNIDWNADSFTRLKCINYLTPYT